MPAGCGYKHSWRVSPRKAIQIQDEIRRRVVERPLRGRVRLIAGVDAALSPKGDKIVAAVVLMRCRGFDPDGPEVAAEDLEVVEEQHAWRELRFPYIPGLLSFREAPAVLGALRKLRRRPDVVILDAQGLAHPRGAGLASHVGVLSGLPCVGCAKSRLTGEAKTPGLAKGSMTELVDKGGKVIGQVVRTRRGVKPVYVSVGNLVSLAQAAGIVLALAGRYRLPEPTRQAHILAGKLRLDPSR